MERFDKIVKDRCCLLSPSQQIRSGFKTKTQLKESVKNLALNRQYVRDGAMLNKTLDSIEEHILTAPGIKAKTGIRAFKLDRDDIVIRPALSDTSSELSFGDFQGGEFPGFHEGFESEEEPTTPVVEPPVAEPVVSSGRGGRRRGAGRYSIRDIIEAGREGLEPRDIRAVDQSIEEIVSELEADEGEFEPPVRRYNILEEEDFEPEPEPQPQPQPEPEPHRLQHQHPRPQPPEATP